MVVGLSVAVDFCGGADVSVDPSTRACPSLRKAYVVEHCQDAGAVAAEVRSCSSLQAANIHKQSLVGEVVFGWGKLLEVDSPWLKC